VGETRGTLCCGSDRLDVGLRGRVVVVDPADRNEWAISDRGDLRDQAGADRQPASLGWRGKHRSHRDVVGAIVHGGSRLLEAVGRPSDQPALKAGKLAHDGRRQVILTQVHPVSVRGDRDVDVIIDDEERVVQQRQPPQRKRDGILLALGHGLLAELDDVGTTLERGLNDARGLDLIPLIARDQVEAHALESLMPLLGRCHMCCSQR